MIHVGVGAAVYGCIGVVSQYICVVSQYMQYMCIYAVYVVYMQYMCS
jgi:hypothetical protein